MPRGGKRDSPPPVLRPSSLVLVTFFLRLRRKGGEKTRRRWQLIAEVKPPTLEQTSSSLSLSLSLSLSPPTQWLQQTRGESNTRGFKPLVVSASRNGGTRAEVGDDSRRGASSQRTDFHVLCMGGVYGADGKLKFDRDNVYSIFRRPFVRESSRESLTKTRGGIKFFRDSTTE